MMIFKFFPFTFWIMLLFDEVRFRDAELSRICKSDYHIRIHRTHECSGQRGAERTNSAVGDAIIDGVSKKWNVFQDFITNQTKKFRR